jgi:hypothetical protein
LQVTLIVFPQATKLSDLDQWRDPLAAIVLYTFDLSILFPLTSPEENFYFSLNKVPAGSFLLFEIESHLKQRICFIQIRET